MRIQLLPENVAEKIAAGEVIERPSSVVKELLENSLDAGATDVAVAFEDGGKGLIEVLDNGRGMAEADLALAVQRHATSKIRALDDLEKLRTLGFRGEALPSIRAVSELSLLSRDIESTRTFEWKSGEVRPATFGHFLGSKHGTRVQARGLFSQVPARLKFLKSNASEVSMTREWMERLALTHPETGFSLTSDGRKILSLRPQSADERIRAILLEGEDYPIQAQTFGESDSFRIRLHWVQGYTAPTTKKMIQIVNGRALRDRLVQQALLSAFKQLLLPGQFPALVLSLDIDPSELDVNVHPTKTEVRFLENRKVFAGIQEAAKRLIEREGAPMVVAPKLFPSPSQISWGAPQDNASRPFAHGAESAFSHGAEGSFNYGAEGSFTRGAADARSDSDSLYFPSSPVLPNAFLTPQAQHSFFGPDSIYRGQLFNTYLMYERAGELWIIDQHAAHERIRYEKLKTALLKRSELSPAQEMLLPEIVHFPIESRSELERKLAYLERLGFNAELFSDDSLVFRSIPAQWGASRLGPRLKSLVERLISLSEIPSGASASTASVDEAIFEKLASEACHSAVRAGDPLSPETSKSIVAELFACEHPWNCPHGRPTVVRVPKGKFEEWFLRRV